LLWIRSDMASGLVGPKRNRVISRTSAFSGKIVQGEILTPILVRLSII
jgi:hypothetical protein